MNKLICYRINNDAPPIVAGRSERAWMDETRQRHAYRCLPLTIANSMGWELLCPVSVTAAWNGGPELDDMKINGSDTERVKAFASSHFGHGILTFHTGYLFRTDPGTALWARGVPNLPKDGIAPLDGIIETDWLDFTFTMNWMFTRPGRVTFEKDEPFCFITPLGYHALDGTVPEILSIREKPELAAAFGNYSDRRRDFTAGLNNRDPQAVRQGWQKWYMRGVQPSGEPGNPKHMSKLRLAEPRIAEADTDKEADQSHVE